MISIIDGMGVGAGKSYFAVYLIAQHLSEGGTCYYSDTLVIKFEGLSEYIKHKYGVIIERSQLNSVSKDEMEVLHEKTPQGTDDLPVLIVMDEAQRNFHSRDWADKSKRSFFDWACESRHDNNNLIIISQHQDNIDKSFRRIATYRYKCINLANVKIMGIPYPFKQFRVFTFMGASSEPIDSQWFAHDKKLFDSYTSKSMAGQHKRLGGAVGRKTLKKVKRKNMKYILIISAVLLVFFGYKFFNGVKSHGILGFGKKEEAGTELAMQEKEEIGIEPAMQEKEEAGTELAKAEFVRAENDGVIWTREGGIYYMGLETDRGKVIFINSEQVGFQMEDGTFNFLQLIPSQYFMRSEKKDEKN